MSSPSDPLVAQGTNATVTFDGEVVVIAPTGVAGKLGRLARAGAAAYRDPASLLDELDGPKRGALLSALRENGGVLAALMSALREGAPDAPQDEVRALTQAIEQNRRRVLSAIERNKGAILQALKADRETANVLLNTYVAVADVERLELDAEASQLRLVTTGQTHSIRFNASAAEAFTQLAEALDSTRTTAARRRTAALTTGVSEQLTALKELLDRELITAGDFEQKKRQLLGLD
jgi:hypothetical protein